MLAGGMTVVAPSMMPAAHAANANLFVSAENSQFDNYMSGPQVIEVVVIDSNINDTDEAKGEPDVTVNGKDLRMVQAVDGNWYGYFADRTMAQTADATASVDVGGPATGLNFGTFCDNDSTGLQGPGGLVFGVPQTVGVAVPGDVTGGVQGTTPIEGNLCTAVGANTLGTEDINVVREEKNLNTILADDGQINVDVDAWPFIQLYDLNPTGNVVVQYNKGGGVQTTTLTFDTVDQFAKTSLDRAAYPQGTEVQVTVTDLWLNIDPTDEDSWTFGTVGTLSTNYQVFDENGLDPGNIPANIGALNPTNLGTLMCEDNCVLRVNPDVQNKPGDVITLQDNADTILTDGAANNSQNPLAWSTGAGANPGGLLAGNVPITVTEQGPNSGIFGSYDESDVSSILITTTAARGTSASFDYNETPVTVLVGFSFATIDIKPVDAEWTSGEEIPVSLVDGDANKNSRADEDLDLNNPEIALIPALRTGTPNTLSGLTAATLDGGAATFTVQKFSDRALLTVGPTATIVAGDTLSMTFGSMANVFNSTPINKSNFHGFVLFNYDVRALANPGNLASVPSVDITLAGVSSNVVAPSVINTFDNAPLQGLILLNTASFSGLAPGTPLTATFAINGAGGVIAPGTVLPVVADVFGFGFTNDGREDNERFANQIIRLELEETGDNTSTFDGTLEYTMINQLTILNPATYTGLTTISDEASFVVIEDLDDEESPRISYLDLGADGVSTQVSDQEAAPAHSGIVSFNAETYKNADTVTITLEDLDLNVDTDLIDIFTVVNNKADPNFDVVGDLSVANGGTSIALSTGDQLGRLLDVTFDDLLWREPADNSSCLAPLKATVGTDTGLGGTGFSLFETTKSSGVFTGDFQIPAAWCRPGASAPESVTGLDIEVNYVDFRDASGEIIEVGDGAGIRANTGSVSLDRTVYPVPFGVPSDFTVSASETTPKGRSVFPIHQTGMDSTAGLQSGEFLGSGDLIVHVRVNDPDFDISAAGEDTLASAVAGTANVGPVKISVIRGSETVILGFAGGPTATNGPINVGNSLIGNGQVDNGEVTVTSSNSLFSGSVTGDPSLFVNGAVTITQGVNVVSATFTNTGVAGLDAGSELSAFGGPTGSFVNGPITITQTGNTVQATFTNDGTPGLGSGSEITNIAPTVGNVIICQTGMPSANCATGQFVNVGTGAVSADEIAITSNINGQTPGPVTIVVGANTSATGIWNDLNGDTNVDSNEITITSGGSLYVNGVATITQVGPGTIATGTFTDNISTLDDGELVVVPSPSGIGFVTGPVTITQVGTGASATGTFVDDPTARQFGPMLEIAPDAGIFETDVIVRYTDGPANTLCPDTADYAPLNGAADVAVNPVTDRFTKAATTGDYCIIQGDILQVEYTDPIDASGDPNTVTDSATFDLRNGVLQSDKSVYIIGSDMILTIIEPDFDLDNDQAETYDLDLVEWDSDAATVSMGDKGGSGAAFDPEPFNFRETGDSTGIFQIVIEIPQTLENDNLERGEEAILEYTDWGPSGSDFVGDEDEDVNLTIFTSNFGATVELDQKVYTWTDKVYITIVAPDHNFDGNLIDEIGNTDLDPIKVSTRGDDIDNYKLVETGTDTGIFTGEVILTGFTHDADGDSTTGDASGNDVVSTPSSGTGPTDGLLSADDDDGITVSFEFSEDETIVGSALIRWNIGETQWLEASYPATGTGVVRIIDPDMNIDPEAVDNFNVDVWSDSDAGGIDLTVTETNEATGIFEGTVFFTVVDESSGHRLRVAEGDTVTAEYEDNTLPNPYTTADELDISATSLIGTIVPPLERAPITACRVVDAFTNTLSSVSVDQQAQITCDIANGQDRDQAFAYLIQVQDGDGVTVSLAWITGTLTPGQSFSPALSWIPTEAGDYVATAFVWESVDNPTALSPTVETPITVK
jgi:hypothetical protein